MRLVIQRVKSASLEIEGGFRGAMGKGLVVYVGFRRGEERMEDAILRKVARKLVALRVFEDENGKLNLAVRDIGGGLMLVSNFTLYGELASGNRPSFAGAMAYDEAKKLFDKLVNILKEECVCQKVDFIAGEFGAYMEIDAVSYGPVNIIWEL